MALPITSGDQTDITKFNAKSAKWQVDDAVHNAISMIPDMDNCEIGWMKFMKGAAPEFVMIKARDYDAGMPFPPRPDGVDSDGKPLFRKGFRVMIKLPDRLAGKAASVREWASNSNATCIGFNKLDDAWRAERDKHPGKLPWWSAKATKPSPVSTAKITCRVLTITKWVPRPDDLSPEVAQTKPNGPVPPHVEDPIGEPEEFDESEEVTADFA